MTLIVRSHRALRCRWTVAIVGAVTAAPNRDPEPHPLALESSPAVVGRSFDLTGDTAHPHRYRYRLDTHGAGRQRWTPDEIIGSVALVAQPNAFREPEAGRWWLLARRAGIDVGRPPHETVPDRYGLRITVTPPQDWRGSLASLLKPLADGLVGAMHAHDGPLTPVLERAAAIHPELTAAELQHHLTAPTTPFGPTRLVVPWRHTLQWLPAADHIVLLDARIETDQPPGTVNADIHLVSPRP